MYGKYAHTNSTTNTPHHLTTTCTVHAPHQLPSPGKHCWAPWVRCSSFEDLREIQTSFMWKSVQWSYVSINSSKWSGKVKIVDLNKKSCSKLYKSMPTSIHFGSICLFWMKYLKIPKRWANLHTTKNRAGKHVGIKTKNHSSILHNEDLPSQAPLHVGDPIWPTPRLWWRRFSLWSLQLCH